MHRQFLKHPDLRHILTQKMEHFKNPHPILMSNLFYHTQSLLTTVLWLLVMKKTVELNTLSGLMETTIA